MMQNCFVIAHIWQFCN